MISGPAAGIGTITFPAAASLLILPPRHQNVFTMRCGVLVSRPRYAPTRPKARAGSVALRPLLACGRVRAASVQSHQPTVAIPYEELFQWKKVTFTLFQNETKRLPPYATMSP
jgi:hypothetical protein